MATTTAPVRAFGCSIENHFAAPLSNKKRPRDDELESLRKERDQLKAALAATQQELEALKKQYEPSEEEVAKSVESLRCDLEHQIRKAMVWRPSCKTNGARLSVVFPNVSRAEYRGLIGAERFDKMSKGKKAEKKTFTYSAKTAEEVESILGDLPGASIRYGGWLSLSFQGQGLRLVYDTTTRKLTAAGKYVL